MSETIGFWKYQYSVKDKETGNIIYSNLKYKKAPSETKIKEFISKDISKHIQTYSRTVRWKTLKAHKNILYCKKQNSMFSILAKIKLIQPPTGEDSCSTQIMLECRPNS